MDKAEFPGIDQRPDQVFIAPSDRAVASSTFEVLQASLRFLGGWLSPIPFPPFTWIPGVIWFVLKMSAVVFMFAMVKAFVPRYRYDQLMRLGWKVFLPLSLAMVVIVAGVLHFAGIAPQ